MAKPNDPSDPRCGFCGAAAKEVNQLIHGMDSYICDGCIQECFEVIEEQRVVKKANKGRKTKSGLPTPKEIMEHLNQFVVGQEDAKKIMAVAVYNHYKRVNTTGGTEISKSNMLVIGPTGSGKTLLAETLAKVLDVPFASADATTLTASGYVGDDVDSILVRLVHSAEGNIRKAEKGIIYIDEIDKIAVQDTRGRDIGGESVQQELLKMLEGKTMEIHPSGNKRNPMSSPEKINTKDILFICGGAFGAILEEGKKRSLGLVGNEEPKEGEKPKKKKLKHKDLVKFGMIPEFVGRLPIIAQLDQLTLEDMVRILTEPKNSLVKQYEELFAIDGVKLKFSKEFLEKVALMAKTEGTGARGLRAIIEPALTELMFNAPDSDKEEIEITPNMLEEPTK